MLTLYVFYQYLIMFSTLHIIRSKVCLKMLSRKMIRISFDQLANTLPFSYLHQKHMSLKCSVWGDRMTPGDRDQRDWIQSLETETEIGFKSVSISRPRPRLFSCGFNDETETETFFSESQLRDRDFFFGKISRSRLGSRLFLSNLEIETETETGISLKIETETEIFSRFLYTSYTLD